MSKSERTVSEVGTEASDESSQRQFKGTAIQLCLREVESEENVRHLYEDKGLDVRGVAKAIGISCTHVYRLLRFYEIELRRGDSRPPVYVHELLTREVLVEMVDGQGLRAPEIAELYGCTRETVYNHLRKHGVKPTGRYANHRPASLTVETVDRLYYKQGHTLQQVAKHIGVSKRTIIRFMDRNNMWRRSRGVQQ